MDENSKAIATAVATVARIEAMSTLLRLAARISATNVALLAHIDDCLWTACAVRKVAGAIPGEPLAIGAPLQIEQTPTARRIAIRDPMSPTDPISEAAVAHHLENCMTAPVVLADGHIFGMLCAFDIAAEVTAENQMVPMFHDVADLISLQIQQLILRDREQAAFLDERAVGQLREQFVAILGHDLRNPLHAIAMASDTLTRRLTDPWGLSMASRIKTNARRMALLIDDVLDFARARLGGGINVELTDVENINAGLATVVQELKDAQPDAEIISSINVSRSVRCDLGRLQQVASNLLGNALTHGQPLSPIKISAHADNEDLVLEVWNEGEPIPPESLSKIFEPFWRHSVSASRNGLGLGLHICSQIVQAHEGRISVTSSRENGTQFTVRLPLSPLPAAQPAFEAAQYA
jgi:signal transduction histidine kinase